MGNESTVEHGKFSSFKELKMADPESARAAQTFYRYRVLISYDQQSHDFFYN